MTDGKTIMFPAKKKKTFRKFFRSYSGLLSKFVEKSVQEHVSVCISYSIFYGDLDSLHTKEGQRHSEFRHVGLKNSSTPSTSNK